MWLIFFSAANEVYCQNLIPNHSFEKVTKIDSFFSRNYTTFNEKMSDWSSPTQSSPDIIHEPYIEKMYMEGTNNIRKNFLIKPLKPKTGKIFVGIKVYGCVPANTHCREYLQVRTLQKLEIGQCYEYSFWTNPLTNGSRINNMGVAFSEDKVNNIQIEEVLDIGNRHGEENIIHPGPGKWQQIKGMISASAEWKYMIIGNFYHDFETEEIQNKEGYPWGYYLVDEVSLIPINCQTGKPIKMQKDLNVTVYFDTNSTKLEEEQIIKIQGLIKNLKEVKYTSIEIIGHADEIGEVGFNQALSVRRANVIANYLSAHGNIIAELRTSGNGEEKPSSLSDNSKNRRVEIKVVF